MPTRARPRIFVVMSAFALVVGSVLWTAPRPVAQQQSGHGR